jgi:YegS/Rv2252/BmrU family lipid kinase
LLVINPGARRVGEEIDHVLDRLWEGDIEVDEDRIEDANDPRSGLVARAGEADLVIVAGGDGSLCRAAPALIDSGLPLGILPMGTANDLARTLGIPADLEQASDIIVAGHTHRIDCGSVNGHPFFNVASIGLSVELARQLSPELKRRWGQLGNALAAFRTLAQARRFSATIREGDEVTRTRTLQIAVGNGRFYGGGTVVASHAAIDDGHLDLYSLEFRNIWRLALMAKSFRTGAHGAWSEVHTARGTEFEIRTRRPRPVNADGELIAETPALFKVHPGAVEVFCPPAAAS